MRHDLSHRLRGSDADWNDLRGAELRDSDSVRVRNERQETRRRAFGRLIAIGLSRTSGPRPYSDRVEPANAGAHTMGRALAQRSAFEFGYST
jgi:hypothetical protein